MGEKVISLAVAVFNMEKYLHRCLDSVLIEGIKNKIEVIAVNDGSTDGSLAIIEKYKTEFPQSVVVINKPNGHYGSCINAALQIARGKYFRPLDADDWFDPKTLVQFVKTLENSGADMVLTNYSKEYAGCRGMAMFDEADIKNIIPGKNYDFNNFELNNCFLVMHAITYKTTILKQMNFKCAEGIHYTDTEYCLYPLRFIKTYTYINLVLYRYFVGRTEQSMSELVMAKNKDHLYILATRMINYLSGNLYSDNIQKMQISLLEKICGYYYQAVLLHTPRNTKDEVKLNNIDLAIKAASGDLYNKIGTSSYCGLINYVELWRHRGKYAGETLPFKLLAFIRNSIKMILSINSHVLKIWYERQWKIYKLKSNG
ncbi:MAG: glycosyltransferase family 2 protein [Bacteroidales bacterium]|jgi:glycosyltransferase involved in cell wall biosynthesis|nr:glycosyltransferase family 2 protein [Bacteroidales bacterium]